MIDALNNVQKRKNQLTVNHRHNMLNRRALSFSVNCLASLCNSNNTSNNDLRLSTSTSKFRDKKPDLSVPSAELKNLK